MEHLAPDWRDDDGRYLPIGVFGLGYGYDPRQVAAGQVPRSAAGFIDPRWSPRLDIAPPPGLASLADLNVADGFRAFITGTAEAQDYRDRFAALIGPVAGPEYR
jgi:hypothetical protein